MTSISECIQRAQRALERSGRKESINDIVLVVASKTQSVAHIKEVCEELTALKVQFVLGENYVQEWETKRGEGLAQYPCHLIGHLQSNKATKASTIFHGIQTIDSLALAKKVSVPELFVQCNISNDTAKHGVNAAEIESLWASIVTSAPEKNLCGLMTIPKDYEDPGATRSDYSKLRILRDTLEQEHQKKIFLSMGMSSDFETALEEGATHIRLGTILFGSRKK